MDDMNRWCPRCRMHKPLAAFGRRSGTDRPTAWCRACKKRYDGDWYQRHKRRHGAAVSRLNARIRARNRQLLERAKDVPCADCGVRYPSFVMDFDHVRGEKRANVSQLAGIGASEPAILAEIAKCDVVCANCHRERTHGDSRGSSAYHDRAAAETTSAEARQLRMAFEQRVDYRLAA